MPESEMQAFLSVKRVEEKIIYISSDFDQAAGNKVKLRE